ncbi:MAG: aminotransferase class V-fold PLP-dependent enzyme [Gammaproteobacteria bacterium]|nr:aminotransferase class V-fold PLP-dependent enzyme [Gammaproteobacteria bacterium]
MINQSLIEREFPQDEELIYLNHAAVSPWPNRTSEAIRHFADENRFTGAENYKKWSAKEITLREQLRSMINAPSVNDIALLKNTSEALSVGACGIAWKDGDNVVITNDEFPSNRFPWEAQREHGVSLNQVPVQLDEPEDALISACDKHTRVMSISSVQYGSGLKLDLDKLGSHCRKNNILFCVDAIQSIGCHQFDVQSMQADFVMADAHKWMLGPEGIALFYCRAEVQDQLKLHQFGWHMVQHAGDYDKKDWQEANNARRFECGSPNMLGTYALSASLSLFEEIGIENIETEIIEKTLRIISQLNDIKGIKLITNQNQDKLAGIVTFNIENADHKVVHAKLMKNRVICAHRFGGIRFSPHFYTPNSKLDKAIKFLTSLI